MTRMKTFNIFEPSFEYDPEDPDGYHAGMDRFGPKIGATRIGASVYELPPGQALCPYHFESDEEWIIVLEGAVSVRHPDGTDVLEPRRHRGVPDRARRRAQGLQRVRGDRPLHHALDQGARGRPVLRGLSRLEQDRCSATGASGRWSRLGENLDYYDGEVP